jgi:hypothetical protein
VPGGATGGQEKGNVAHERGSTQDPLGAIIKICHATSDPPSIITKNVTRCTVMSAVRHVLGLVPLKQRILINTTFNLP